MAEKIVITGLSAVSSCGVGFEALKNGIAAPYFIDILAYLIASVITIVIETYFDLY